MDNFIFELKVKELDVLKKNYKLQDDILFLMGEQIQILGCKHCYKVQAEATPDGYRIPFGYLINLKEKLEQENQLEHYNHSPNEVVSNCWLCPHCFRLFDELCPEFDLLGVNNVSI
jgi:hypothetical protein